MEVPGDAEPAVLATPECDDDPAPEPAQPIVLPELGVRPPRVVDGVVFINYRRASAAEAILVEERLRRRYSDRWVFRDVENLGEQWPDQLEATIDSCRAVVAVIGTGWERTIRDRQALGPSSRDWVRWELVRAREAGKPIIPALVDRAEVRAAELPSDLAFIGENQAHVLRPGDRASLRRSALRELAKEVDHHLPWHARRLYRWLVGVIALATIIALLIPVRSWWNARQLPEFSLEEDRVVLIAPPVAPDEVGSALVDEAMAGVIATLTEAAADTGVEVVELTQAQWAGEGDRDPGRVIERTEGDMVLLPAFSVGPGEVSMTVAVHFGLVPGAEPLAGTTVVWLDDGTVVQDGRVESGALWHEVGMLGAVATAPIIDVALAFDALDTASSSRVVSRLSTALDSTNDLDGPASAMLHLLRGNALLALGESDGARDDFDVAAKADGELGERGRLGSAFTAVSTAILDWCPLESGPALSDSIMVFDDLIASGTDSTQVKAHVGRSQAIGCLADAAATTLSLEREIETNLRSLEAIDDAIAVFELIDEPTEETEETLAVGLVYGGDRLLRLAELRDGAASQASLDDAIARLDAVLDRDLELRTLTKFDLHRLRCIAHERRGETAEARAARDAAEAALGRHGRGELVDPYALATTADSLECGQ